MTLKPRKIAELTFSGSVNSSTFNLADGVVGETAQGYKNRSLGVLVPTLVGTKVTLQIKGDQSGFRPLHTGMPSVPVEVLEDTFLPLGFVPLGVSLRAVSDLAEVAGPVIELWLI